MTRALLRGNGDGGSFLETRTGEVVELLLEWSDDGFSGQDAAEGIACGRLVPIDPLPPEVERAWMTAFAEGLDDGWARDELRETLGAGSLRRFEAVLGRFPEERQRWRDCYEAHVRAVLDAWLDAHDIEPACPQEGKLLRGSGI